MAPHCELSTAALQVMQYKGVPCQAMNTIRAIAFMLVAVEDNIRCEKLVSQVKERIAAEGNVLSAKTN